MVYTSNKQSLLNKEYSESGILDLFCYLSTQMLKPKTYNKCEVSQGCRQHPCQPELYSMTLSQKCKRREQEKK